MTGKPVDSPGIRTDDAPWASVELAQAQFADWRWRLNNLYWIVDREGVPCLFQMNWGQERLFDEMDYMNVILKSRQIGFTTFIQLFMLDACLFNSDVRCGTVAHTLPDAQIIFRDKVRHPYDRLPDQLKTARGKIGDTASELLLSNNSSIRVGTSLRSATTQYLHISEYGKICAKYPEKAREIRTGALNTVKAGQIVFIESTAEGQEGHFYEICENAQAMARMGDELTPLDFKFHFFAWWEDPQNDFSAVDAAKVTIPSEFRTYFRELEEEHGITLTPTQKAWYVKKEDTQQDDMMREFPATPAEAFAASIEGAYYGKQMRKAELEGRIGHFPAEAGLPVHTVWDIGRDTTAIWFFQNLPQSCRIVGYYHNSGEGMPFYVGDPNIEDDRGELGKIADRMGWKYGTDYMPHDIRVKEWGSDLTRIEQMIARGRNPELVPEQSVEDGINAARQILGLCTFDKSETVDGVKGLKNYRKEWDEDHGIWKNRPLHNWASHPADAFRYLSLVFQKLKPALPVPLGPVDLRGRRKPMPPKVKTLSEMTWNEVLKANRKHKRKRSRRV